MNLTKPINLSAVLVCKLHLGKKSPPQWLAAMLKENGVDFLISRFEGGGLLSQPTLRDLTGPFSVRATLQWMDLLLAVLDCYNTFISLHIIEPQHMLSKSYTCLIIAVPGGGRSVSCSGLALY